MRVYFLKSAMRELQLRFAQIPRAHIIQLANRLRTEHQGSVDLSLERLPGFDDLWVLREKHGPLGSAMVQLVYGVDHRHDSPCVVILRVHNHWRLPEFPELDYILPEDFRSSLNKIRAQQATVLSSQEFLGEQQRVRTNG